MREEYDFDDPPRRRPPPGLSVPVLLAGIGWILFSVGCLLLTAFMIVGIIAFSGKGDRQGDVDVRNMMVGILIISGVIYGGLGTLFMFFGVPAVRGRSRDVIVQGIVSLVAAGLFVALAIAEVIMTNAMRPAGPQPKPSGAAPATFCTCFFAVWLGTCGVLALAGRTSYLRWRAARRTPREVNVDTSWDIEPPRRRPSETDDL